MLTKGDWGARRGFTAPLLKFRPEIPSLIFLVLKDPFKASLGGQFTFQF